MRPAASLSSATGWPAVHPCEYSLSIGLQLPRRDKGDDSLGSVDTGFVHNFQIMKIMIILIKWAIKPNFWSLVIGLIQNAWWLPTWTKFEKALSKTLQNCCSVEQGLFALRFGLWSELTLNYSLQTVAVCEHPSSCRPGWPDWYIREHWNNTSSISFLTKKYSILWSFDSGVQIS